MRLVSVETKEVLGDSEVHAVVFEHDGRKVMKCFELTSLAVAVDPQANRLRQLLRNAKEAARDIAFAVHGKDWYEHVTWRDFGGTKAPYVPQLLSDAKRMRPDLFGEPDAAASR